MKKRVLKKIVSLALGGLMTVSLLSGCGREKSTENLSLSNEASGTVQEEEPYVVTMLTQGEQ